MVCTNSADPSKHQFLNRIFTQSSNLSETNLSITRQTVFQLNPVPFNIKTRPTSFDQRIALKKNHRKKRGKHSKKQPGQALKEEETPNADDENNADIKAQNLLPANNNKENTNKENKSIEASSKSGETLVDILKKPVLLRGGKVGGRGRGRGGRALIPKKPVVPEKKVKGERKWTDAKLTSEEMKSLDFSPSDAGSNRDEKEEELQFGKFDLENLGDISTQNGEEEEETEQPEKTSIEKNGKTESKKSFFSWFTSLTNRVVTKEDLSPVLASFKQHLITKNVASEIADKLCESISVSLEGKKLGSFERLQTVVKESLSAALERILTPSRHIDILREVAAVNANGRPYTIVFCGVNGVGKSTNLAKICFWLQENGLKVQIVACDTFRSGAVEQLLVHAHRLKVPLYEEGYGKDAANIAANGIKKAKDNGINVVLIDTAGRMQDNEPLMKALSKLVNTNNPDLVLFVGEALVGNDAVDQLTKFNQALVDLSPSKTPRLMDAIILTKFDTIDDKVGAALSMVYTTGSPILFVGTGQHYTDLKKMNVSAVVQALLNPSS